MAMMGEGCCQTNAAQQIINYCHFRNVVFDISLCEKALEAGTSLLRVNDSMKSFPSGHSQLALFASLFIIVSLHLQVQHLLDFLQVYISKRRSYILLNLLNLLLQTVALLLATYCAYSRLTDHRHHLVDVLTGSVLGIILGIFTAQTLDFGGDQNKKDSKKYI